MRKVWDIHGGIHPAENKHQSIKLPLGHVPLASELLMPVNQHIGKPAIPVVNVGDAVLTGQLIAKADGPISANIHAPSSGTVSAIEDRTLPHPSGGAGLCIAIATDGKENWVELQANEDYLSLDHNTLIDKIRDAGIAGMGGAGFPAAIKLNPRGNCSIDTLILNGTECEPYITADDWLMQHRADEVVAGAQLLAHLLGEPDNVLIGIEDNKPKAIAAVQKALLDAEIEKIEVVSFPTKYPSGGEKQLIQILTGREVPSGKLPADIGVVCQNVGSSVAAYRAARYGEPLISRITTVVGEALDTQRNIEVPLGTPIGHILEHHGLQASKVARLIMGGPMMGFSLHTADVPIIKTTNCILAPSKQEMPEPPPAQACIRCGMCAEACPASLLPQQLFWYSMAEDFEKLEAHNIADCIECGACSYVCPSNIPLVQHYRASKGTIRQNAIDKEKSDRSRARFEFRQVRIEKAEREKEAKRQARKLAAEAAKKKMAEKQAAGESTEGSPDKADVVAKAIAAVKKQDLTPEEMLAKLERALSSSESRLEKTLARAETAEGDKKDAILARVKDAELKVSDAKQKLADFQAKNQAAAPSSDSAPAAASEASDDVASVAIAKAKAKAAELASMSPEEKKKQQLVSLTARLEKARARLEKAEAEQDENLEAFRTGYEKTLAKHQQLSDELSASQENG